MVASKRMIKLAGPVLERLLGLAPPRSPEIDYDPDQFVTMPDGVKLSTDTYRPAGVRSGPAVLIRTPYGKKGVLSLAYGVLLARRGLSVVVQDVRGAYGSEGVFEPFHHEKADGLATLDWLRAQPWCNGEVGTAGASYLGHTQWSIGPYADPPLAAMALAITTSSFGPSFYPGRSMSLYSVVFWASLIGTQNDGLSPAGRLRQLRRVRRAMTTLPVADADETAVGRHLTFLAEVAEHAEPEDPFWDGMANDQALEQLPTPVSMVTGWSDLFADRQLRDFTRLQDAGVPARLTVGPWFHGQPTSVPYIIKDHLSFLEGRLLGDAAALQRSPVRLYLQGAKQWLDFDRWPVPATDQAWSLGVDGIVGPGTPAAGARSFVYDPAEPTPSVGGAILSMQAGQRDNAEIEVRPDVLIYSSEPMIQDLDVIGEIRAQMFVRTAFPDADVFVRVCDVDRAGRSMNVTDKLIRLRASDQPEDDLDTRRVELTLWPTAYRFLLGHRIRVQVSGGAMPNYVRNHQTGEAIAGAVRTQVGRTEVLHGPEHPSLLLLPVFGGHDHPSNPNYPSNPDHPSDPDHPSNPEQSSHE